MAGEAEAALRLADAYLQEVNSNLGGVAGDPDTGSQLMETLKLALTQISKVESLNPGASVDGLDVPFLKATAISMKGSVLNLAFGKRAAAISEFEEALRISETLPGTHWMLGSVYGDMGRREEAMTHIKRAIELDPENMQFRKDLGRLESASGVGLRLGAFQGSWKALTIIGGIALLGLFTSKFAVFFIFGAIAVAYWWFKSRS